MCLLPPLLLLLLLLLALQQLFTLDLSSAVSKSEHARCSVPSK